MKEERLALEQNKTWDLTTLPPRKKAVGCSGCTLWSWRLIGHWFVWKTIWLSKDILRCMEWIIRTLS